MCHQMMILLQINASQMVLIRIPIGMGLFNKRTMFQRIQSGIRSNLLSRSINEKIEEAERDESFMDEDEKHKAAIGRLQNAILELKRI